MLLELSWGVQDPGLTFIQTLPCRIVLNGHMDHMNHVAGVSFESKRGGQLALDVNGRNVMVSISHVGVEAAALDRWMASEQAAEVARAFSARHPGKTIIAGIDSCQRLSGIALKLLAFERLLQVRVVVK